LNVVSQHMNSIQKEVMVDILFISFNFIIPRIGISIFLKTQVKEVFSFVHQ